MRILISTMFLVVIAVSACVAYPVMPQAEVDARRTVTAEALLVEPTAVILATEEPVQQNCDIKMNVSSSGDRVFHVPGGAYYDRVRVDFDQGDGYACTESQAVAEGFRKSSR